MIAVNKTLYHVSLQKWDVGDIIRAGEKDNPFWSFSKAYNPKIEIENQEISFAQLAKQETTAFCDTKESAVLLTENMKAALRESTICIREMCFEKIRKQNYWYRPSRQKCLWVTNKENLLYWIEQKGLESCYVLKLCLTGKLFKCNAQWLENDTFSSEEYEKRAEQYWKGVKKNLPTTEYLFCGRGVVEEVTLYENGTAGTFGNKA